MKNINFLNKEFRLFLILAIILWMVQQFYALALPLIIYNKSHSSIYMSIAKGVEFVPNIILAIFIGTITDKFNKKSILLLSLFGQFIALSLIAYYATKSGINIMLYILIFLFMCCFCFFNNLKTIIVKQVCNHNELIIANSILQSCNQLIQILIPILFIITAVITNLILAIIICSCLLLVCIGLSTLIKIPNTQKHTTIKQSFITYSIVEPIKVLFNTKKLWNLSWFAMIINIVEGSNIIIYIYWFKNTLKLNNLYIGTLFFIIGAGAIAGGSLVGYLRKILNNDYIFILIYIFVSILNFLLLAFIQNIYIIYITIFIQNAFATMIAILIWTTRQETIKISALGRITGLTSAIFKLAMPFGIPILGMLLDTHIKMTFIICACIYTFAILLYSILEISNK